MMRINIFKIKSFWLSVVICLLPIALSAVFYDKMPDMTATHFGIDFEPDGFSPKWMAVFVIPSFMLALNVFTWIIIEADPKGQGINEKMKGIIRWIIPVLSVIVQCGIVMYAVKGMNIVRFVPLIIGILFIITGNYLPKCRQNFTAGIRLPWTLASEENWNRTHRFAGKLWIVGGFLMTMYTFFEMSVFVFIGVLMLTVIVPAVYSYLLYRNGKSEV